jgi:hypothetical protein
MIKDLTTRVLGTAQRRYSLPWPRPERPARRTGARTTSTGGSTEVAYAYSYGTNGAVGMCDTLADGHGVSVQYERVPGPPQ